MNRKFFDVPSPRFAPRRSTGLRRAALVAAALAAFAGCGDAGEGAGGSGGSGSTTSSAASGSTVATSSAAGTTSASSGTGGQAAAPTVTLEVNPTTMAAGDTVQGTVTVTNFILEKPVGQPNEPGHGHYHVYLDGATGGNYLVAGQTPTISIKIPAATQPGAHTLRVSLGDNDHAPLVPAVEDTVDISVQ